MEKSLMFLSFYLGAVEISKTILRDAFEKEPSEVVLCQQVPKQ
jgi:hypothetical protein